jgi:hypothetical protein
MLLWGGGLRIYNVDVGGGGLRAEVLKLILVYWIKHSASRIGELMTKRRKVFKNKLSPDYLTIDGYYPFPF